VLDYGRGDPWFGPLQAPLRCVTDRPYPLILTLALVRENGLVGEMVSGRDITTVMVTCEGLMGRQAQR